MNLMTLLSKGRGAMLEFVPEPEADKLAELIVAFANAVGGTILVGMDEQQRVHPDAVSSLEPALARAVSLCDPPLQAADLLEWHLEETPQGQIAAITVRPARQQPLSVAGRGIFVRSGALNVRLSAEQFARGGRLPQAPNFEDNILPSATLEDLDEDVIEEYHRNRIKRGPRGESFTRDELLRDVGAVDVNGALTVAGMLLFGKHPQRFLPQVGVVIVRFKGTSMHDVVTSSERYSRRFEIVGPAARMVERTWQVLAEETQHRALVSGLARQEVYDYPIDAVREAVVNAICHRDYSLSGQRIEIRLFDDRMEIMSPGGLPGHITLENILEEHYSRNPRLVRGLYYWGYIEELGQGIDIIYDAMRREHHPPPEFRATERSFTLTLRSAIDQIELQYGDRLNPRQVQVLKYLEAHERITNREYQQLCPDVSPETLRLDLRDLVKKGILLDIGDKRGRYYVLK